MPSTTSKPAKLPDLNKDLRVLRVGDLESGFHVLSNEIDPDNPAQSLYVPQPPNAVILENFTEELDSSTPMADSLATGLMLSIPYHDALALFVGYTYDSAHKKDKHGPFKGLGTIPPEKLDLETQKLDNKRLHLWLINKENAKFKHKRLVKSIRTTTWADVSSCKATIHATKSFDVESLAACAASGRELPIFFLKKNLNALCSPVPMAKLTSPQMAVMMPSFMETVSYILRAVLEDKALDKEMNSPEERACFLNTGLTPTQLADFYQSLNAMIQVLNRPLVSSLAVINEVTQNENLLKSRGFGAYLDAVEEILKKKASGVTLTGCVPVHSLNRIVKEKLDDATTPHLLNRLVAVAHLIEIVQLTDNDDLELDLRLQSKSEPSVYLLQKCVQGLRKIKFFDHERPFKPLALHATIEDASEQGLALNALEGDELNPYQPFKALALTPDGWISFLRGI